MLNRIIICGSRTYQEPEPMKSIIHKLPRGTTVVCGGAKGADELAIWLTRPLEPYLHLEVYNAEWENGRGAGVERNQKMLDLGADLLLAFRMSGNSPGTEDMFKRALKQKIPAAMWLHAEQCWVRY